MAQKKSHFEEEESEINMTPMLDVVFIMLIFFIVTASFVKEAGLDVTKPVAEKLQPKPQANIFIAVGPDGKIFIDKREVDITNVQINIERLYAENPEGSIVIQSDKAAPAKAVVDIIEAAKNVGIRAVALATEEVQ